MFCPHCGASIADDAKFCAACGNLLPEDTAGTTTVSQTVAPQAAPQSATGQSSPQNPVNPAPNSTQLNTAQPAGPSNQGTLFASNKRLSNVIIGVLAAIAVVLLARGLFPRTTTSIDADPTTTQTSPQTESADTGTDTDTSQQENTSSDTSSTTNSTSDANTNASDTSGSSSSNSSSQSPSSQQETTSLVDAANQVAGYTFKVDSSSSVVYDGMDTHVYTGTREGAVPYYQLTLMESHDTQTVDDLLLGTMVATTNRLEGRFAQEPTAFTLHLSNREVHGYGYAYTNESGTQTFVAQCFIEEYSGYFFTWTCVYEAGDEATADEMYLALETFQFLAS